MRVELVYIEAGGGHRASAEALLASLASSHPHWEVRAADLFQILDPDNRFGARLGIRPADLYNKRLSRGWTLGMAQELKLLQFGIAACSEWLQAKLRRHWAHTRPDLVVSLIPNFNRVLGRSLCLADRRIPFATLMTDFADNPPDFWVEPDLPHQALICGTPRAVEQALKAGCAPERVWASSGMIIHADFYRPFDGDRATERARLGLDPLAPTALVSFGAHGSRRMRQIERVLQDTQLILLCGRNRMLAEALRAVRARKPRLIVEFTREVPRYLRLADFFIGKPGPGSIAEAVAVGCPVIVERNAWTMPQEAYNPEWVEANGVGIVTGAMKTYPAAVARMIRELDAFRARAACQDNRAVFEVPAILERIAAQPPHASVAHTPIHAGRKAARLRSMRSLIGRGAARRPSPPLH
jgi:hypothetical protein